MTAVLLCIAIGQEWRVGFLGLLHMDMFRGWKRFVMTERGVGGKMISCFLSQEYDASIIVTSPSVPYRGGLLW